MEISPSQAAFTGERERGRREGGKRLRFGHARALYSQPMPPARLGCFPALAGVGARKPMDRLGSVSAGSRRSRRGQVHAVFHS